MKNNKAITLIALIITIIVLLILAGVTINMVLGENGIINKSKTSVAKYENAQSKENTALAGYETEIDNARETVTISKEEYDQMKNEIQTLKNRDNYSTEERIIGTWKDGKTLYQKDFYFNTIFSDYDISSLNYDYITIDWSVSCVNVTIQSGDRYSFIPFYLSSSDKLDVRIRHSAKNLICTLGDVYTFSDAYIRFKYTKSN